MSTTSEYEVGTEVRLTVTFRNFEGVVTDPTAVALQIKEPDGVLTAYAYPPAGTITKVSAGVYAAQVLLDKSGPWLYRWEGTGAVNAAREGTLIVDESEFS